MNSCFRLALLFALFAPAAAAQEPLQWASGSWFDPARNGEGFVVQVLPDSRAVVTWFTYPPAGEDAEQAWLIGSGRIEQDRIVVAEVVRPRGAVFGPGFDPTDVVREAWGSLEIRFDDCHAAVARWDGPAEFGAGEMDLLRLSRIDDLHCPGEAAPGPDRVIAARSGAWFDPAHDGEGWLLENLPDGRMVVYWFTYDDQGRQAWMIGEAHLDGATLLVDDLYATSGARFGASFDPAAVVLRRWGRFGFLFDGCESGRLRWESTDPRFDQGTLQPVQLARLAGTDCTEPPPVAALTGGQWRQSADLDAAVSESASVALDGHVYVAGGFGHARRLQRLDPVGATWNGLADLPADRHHPMAATDGRYVYLAGGYVNRVGEVAGSNFWRFEPTSGQWEILGDMPRARAAGAAVYLHGRVWIVGGVGVGGELMGYDVLDGDWELHGGAPLGGADHLQAVAFENEIWRLGGRDDQTSLRVDIWNPVSREWREGPSMAYVRSGFAARVVQGQIMVAGGERIDLAPAQLIRTMEIFAPGAEAWVPGPPPPIPVHGTTGASLGGNLYLTGGSEVAGMIGQNRATQVYEPAE